RRPAPTVAAPPPALDGVELLRRGFAVDERLLAEELLPAPRTAREVVDQLAYQARVQRGPAPARLLPGLLGDPPGVDRRVVAKLHHCRSPPHPDLDRPARGRLGRLRP